MKLEYKCISVHIDILYYIWCSSAEMFCKFSSEFFLAEIMPSTKFIDKM